MILFLGPFAIDTQSKVCDFHRKHPGQKYEGCTCSKSWTTTLKSAVDKSPTVLAEEHYEP
jgi:hypothetical protein